MATTRAKRDIDWEVNALPPLDIALSRAWQANVTNFSNPPTSDLNRLGLIAIHNEDSAEGSIVTNVAVNGQNAIPLVTSFNQSGGTTGFSNEFALYYLTEAQLNIIGTNPAITVTFSGTPDVFTIGTAIYANVNQASPTSGINEFNGVNITGANSLAATAEDGGVSIYVSGGGSPVTSVTVTSYIEVADISNLGGDAFIFEKLPSVSPTETASATITGTFNRYVSFIANLRRA